MTKLESGAIKPNTARHDIGEIVGSALRRASKILAHHKVSLELAAELPMLELDAVLFDRRFSISWTTRPICAGGYHDLHQGFAGERIRRLADHRRRRGHSGQASRRVYSINSIARKRVIMSAPAPSWARPNLPRFVEAMQARLMRRESYRSEEAVLTIRLRSLWLLTYWTPPHDRCPIKVLHRR